MSQAGEVAPDPAISWPRALGRRLRLRSSEWTRKLICSIENARLRVRPTRLGDRPIELLCLVDLVQDLDVILPIALAARRDGRYAVTICMTTWLNDVAPWVPERLKSHDFTPIPVVRKHLQTGEAPDLMPYDMLLTACESTAAAHRFAHALVRKANRMGVHTFTLQHGLENLGLTSRAGGDFEFASQAIFVWRAPNALPHWVPATRRRRCVGVGRARLAEKLNGAVLPVPRPQAPLVAVFENLHWDRYPPEYSKRFLTDLFAAARANPDMEFLIKPHPAGLWLVKNPEALEGQPDNLTIARPGDPQWGQITADAIIDQAAAVVTTPSTVTLDAALQSKPVAVAAYGLDLGFYAPLPTIDRSEDWSSFLSEVRTDGRAFGERLRAFRRRHLLEGDARDRILNAMAERIATSQPRS